jgi:hypothetical protein
MTTDVPHGFVIFWENGPEDRQFEQFDTEAAAHHKLMEWAVRYPRNTFHLAKVEKVIPPKSR